MLLGKLIIMVWFVSIRISHKGEHMSYGNIAIAISGTKEDNILLDKALVIATGTLTEITLIHVESELDIYSGVYQNTTEDVMLDLDQEMEEHMHGLMNKLKGKNAKWQIICGGTVSDTLYRIVSDGHYDLLICGHNHSFWHRLMPVARSLINKIPADLLIVYMT